MHGCSCSHARRLHLAWAACTAWSWVQDCRQLCRTCAGTAALQLTPGALPACTSRLLYSQRQVPGAQRCGAAGGPGGGLPGWALQRGRVSGGRRPRSRLPLLRRQRCGGLGWSGLAGRRSCNAGWRVAVKDSHWSSRHMELPACLKKKRRKIYQPSCHLHSRTAALPCLRNCHLSDVDRLKLALAQAEGDIDVLLTCEWPQGLCDGLAEAAKPQGIRLDGARPVAWRCCLGGCCFACCCCRRCCCCGRGRAAQTQPGSLAAPQTRAGAAVCSEVAMAARPRYHICGGKDHFWARPPYINADLGAGAHVTRFISLGRVRAGRGRGARFCRPAAGGAAAARQQAGEVATAAAPLRCMPPCASRSPVNMRTLPPSLPTGGQRQEAEVAARAGADARLGHGRGGADRDPRGLHRVPLRGGLQEAQVRGLAGWLC